MSAKAAIRGGPRPGWSPLAAVRTALLAAMLAAGLLTLWQEVTTAPLLAAAERAEHAGAAAGEVAADPLRRAGLRLIANLGLAAGFGLLLAAGMALAGATGWRRGLLWGLAGFAAFALAPALGLPPRLPGTATADLLARQLWWLATAIATSAGLALVFLRRTLAAAVAGLVLVALPHLVGAPLAGAPLSAEGRAFAMASLADGLVLWLALGFVLGRLTPPGPARPASATRE